MSNAFGRGPMRASRRQVLGFSVAAAGLVVAAGCSAEGDGGGGDPGADELANQSKGAMDGFTADTPFKATEPFTLSVLWTDWPDLPVKDSWTFFKEIEKRTGVTLETTHIPFSDATEKRNLLISAGDAPSVIPLVYTGDEESFVSSGAILPMSDYVKHMPNFNKYVQEWDLAEMITRLKQSDGKSYMVPGLQEVSVPVFTVIIRKDAFDEVGAGVPQTWEEMREALLEDQGQVSGLQAARRRVRRAVAAQLRLPRLGRPGRLGLRRRDGRRRHRCSPQIHGDIAGIQAAGGVFPRPRGG